MKKSRQGIEEKRQQDEALIIGMRKQHKVREFNVGESVSVHIPQINQASTDPQRLPCIVVEVVGKAQAMF